MHRSSAALGILLFLSLTLFARAADRPQWGEAWTRNQVSDEAGLPAEFDVETGKNLRWTARLGTESHSTPVIAGGRVFIGTNNGEPRDPKHVGDRGVVLCLDERDGTLLWQLVAPKREEDPYFDWPGCGVSSAVTVDGDRAYLLDNRGVVLCLDVKGLADGNDGPFQDEGHYMTPRRDSGSAPPTPQAGAGILPEPGLRPLDREPLTPGLLDADIVWMFDLVTQAGTWPHDGAHSSILIHGEFLYLNTSTGVDNTHRRIRTPDAPSLVVLDKQTGSYVAREKEGLAPSIFHCTWSSPALATVDGEPRIFFAGGDGIVHGFRPVSGRPSGEEPLALEKVYHYDIDPAAPKQDIHRYVQNRRESPSNIYGMPVVVEGKLYVAGGGDVFWGKNDAWLQCADASGAGNVTGKALRWSYPLRQHTLSTAAVAGGLVYVSDTGKTLHCVDAETGQPYWTQDCGGAIWASPFVADGKVYIGSRNGDFWILAAGREKKVLLETDLPAPVSATATAANGVLYVATMTHLYAIAAPE